MADLERELKSIRADLDGLDEKLVRLINERACLAKRIGEAKSIAGLHVYEQGSSHR